MHKPEQRILLTGATGYVGGRLLAQLERSGQPVRCLARQPEFLRPRVASTTQVVRGDVTDRQSLLAAMQGVDTAYYLIHSMAANGDFEERDREAARNFGSAARAAGVRRIVYLGGLGSGSNLSPHLASRQEVGRILRESSVATIEFRASIVIGSGSLSFEMIRALVDRLPFMIIPKWVRVQAQPIAIEDVIAYLIAALDYPAGESRIFEIGGADVASYQDIMKEYARQRGLRRFFVPVPVLTPRLSSLWLGLVTPLYARVGRKLVDSLRNETVVRDQTASAVLGIAPRGLREAIERALTNEDKEFAATRWSDARSSQGKVKHWGGTRFGSRLVDTRTAYVERTPAQAFQPIRRIGGKTGWYYGNWMWRVRGWLDLLFGGAGMRRGRRDTETMRPGDTVDFWRVEAFEPDHFLRLSAEMKIPGRAWLQFEVDAADEGSTICQTAIFDPAGVLGLLYWYSLYPIHEILFAGMLRRIAREACNAREV
ncbi:MAG: SDR family oxidoreductase [Acidobacteria bacterium]|nr:SDR family oxidoreductase [Acidobacteriota bacterium]